VNNIDALLDFVSFRDGVPIDEIEWFSWPHAFPSTTGPRGGCGGCTITTFQVFAFNSGVNRYKWCSGVWRSWDGQFMGRW